MIVLDSSVLVGIIKGEADVVRLIELLASEDCATCAITEATVGVFALVFAVVVLRVVVCLAVVFVGCGSVGLRFGMTTPRCR